jgi:hypothetical protein
MRELSGSNMVDTASRLSPVHPDLARSQPDLLTGSWTQRLRTISSVENVCGYPHAFFLSLNSLGEATATIVVRATFQLGDLGLQPAQEQQPVRMADEFYGDPTNSSMRAASDLAIFKPSAEVIFIDPIARSESGTRRPSWTVSVRVAQTINYSFTVSGETTWSRRFGSWKVGPPRPCRLVPVLYEFSHADVSSNPSSRVGQPKSNDRPKESFGPRLFSHSRSGTVDSHSDELTGLGPIAPHWKARLRYAGTYDNSWLSENWPLLAEDFDYQFFNSAHPGLRATSYFDGNECFSITGMCRSGRKEFQLPGLPAPGITMFANSSPNRFFATTNLDTVELDLNRKTVSLIWRSAFEPPDESVTVRISPELPEGCDHAA